MTAKRDTQNMDAARPSVEDLEKMTDAQRKKALAKMAKADAEADEVLDDDLPDHDPQDPEAPDDEDAIKAQAEKPGELDGAQKRPRCPKCGSPRYKVVSSPALVQYCKCEYCGHGFKLAK